MASQTGVFDVAAYIAEALRERSPKLTAMKLQKLLYYCQAWSLVWNEEPLFPEQIEAWANGPVIKELYEWHRGMLQIESVPQGNSDLVTTAQRETIDRVLEAYGGKTAQWLSDLTHLEAPWREARKGHEPGARGSAVITLGALHEYYSGLDEASNTL